MTGILELPLEVSLVIVTQLPGSGIKALRATCRQLYRVASPLLFPVLYLSCHQLDLDVFRLVANNQLIVGGVRELIIDDTTLAPSLAAWRVCQAVASHEHHWLNRRRPYITNRTADEDFSRGAQSRASSSPTAWGWPMERTIDNLFGLDWLDDELQRQIGEGGLPDAVKLRRGGHGRVGEGDRSIRSVARPARAVLVALEVLADPNVRSQLTEFRLDASHNILNKMYQPGIPIGLFNDWSPLPARLVAGFGAATNLTKFYIAISNERKHWDGQSAIPDVVTYKRLRLVGFSCGDIAPAKLKSFLQRHGATLEEMRVEYCNIDSESEEGQTWEGVVRDVTNLQYEGTTKLRKVLLSSVYGFKPWTGCGRNNTKSITDRDEATWTVIIDRREETHTWTYSVDRGWEVM
ncbi:hypothetical protein MKZ38_004390 [Zalerion maritima]|uniref:F-box domain-containing protein n=1 Tax=Zalerion maritima TaxID=339359 RepID=A0AAD5WPJ9_9PEZI|nr:hypothetical protein MKZ38_004390 [Zalerion maritima]